MFQFYNNRYVSAFSVATISVKEFYNEPSKDGYIHLTLTNGEELSGPIKKYSEAQNDLLGYLERINRELRKTR